MWSTRLIEWHFWIATTGILLYITAMWVSGIMEGLMWREYTPQGFLANSFIETVSAKHVENIVRMAGGLMYLSGALIMAFLRNGCQQMGWPNYIQEIVIGSIIVLAVALDRLRQRRTT